MSPVRSRPTAPVSRRGDQASDHRGPIRAGVALGRSGPVQACHHPVARRRVARRTQHHPDRKERTPDDIGVRTGRSGWHRTLTISAAGKRLIPTGFGSTGVEIGSDSTESTLGRGGESLRRFARDGSTRPPIVRTAGRCPSRTLSVVVVSRHITPPMSAHSMSSGCAGSATLRCTTCCYRLDGEDRPEGSCPGRSSREGLRT